jgi:nucleoside phosphorylase
MMLATCLVPAGARAAAPCTPRLLVLSAFPGEIGPLLSQTSVNASVETAGRTFFSGRLRGHDVVLALTGIGMVNATRTATLGLGQFRCGRRTAISGIVFSGVSGGRTFIGDVTVPARWTDDDGTSWLPVDPALLSVAQSVKAVAAARLSRAAPAGDAACAGVDPDLLDVVTIDHTPEVIAGGDGRTSDPFGGRALPCAPSGGDVFGCRPCKASGPSVADAERFVPGALPFVDPGFVTGYFAASPSTPAGYDADDMETAAVARVAASNRVPFIAFRALSDGKGDPLMLPGFPFQFFVYRQLAADNAATMTLAFLDAL